jgi:alpha-glucosidase (family GH31 glycosyl hydrolase)
MPYIYAAAIEANQNGTPVQRSTFIEFPEDKTTYYLDLQYMFGPALLVAPVFGTDTEEVEWYIPAGRWTSFWSPSDVITGPTWVKRKVPYDEVPVFVRPGSIICLGKEGLKQPDYEYAKGVEVRVYELEEGGVAEAVVPSGKGTERVARVRAERKDGEVVVDLVEGNLEEAWSARWIANGRTAAVADGSDKVDVVVNVTAGGKQAVLKV